MSANGAWQEFKDLQEEKFRDLDETLREGFEKLDKRLEDLSGTLVDVLTGKDVMASKTAQELLGAQAESFSRIIKTMAWAFGVIIAILVGLKTLAPQTLVTYEMLDPATANASVK